MQMIRGINPNLFPGWSQWIFLTVVIFLYKPIAAFSLSEETKPFATITTYPVADVLRIPQDARKIPVPNFPLFPKKVEVLRSQLRKKYFSPWHKTTCSFLKETVIFNAQKMLQGGLGENYLPLSMTYKQALVENSNLDAYGSLCQPGIIVATADVRSVPTSRPYFDDPSQGGNGYPFDQFQETQLSLGSPVLILHTSRDRVWSFIQTNDHAYGWIPSSSVAKVSSAQRRQLESLPLLIITSDHETMLQKDGNVRLQVKMGSYLPLTREKKLTFFVKIPTLGPKAYARFETQVLPRQVASRAPYEFTSPSLEEAVNSFLGKPYGWGTMLGNRDCSALVHDFYSLFGIWLPRNSSAQGNVFGKSIDLTGKSKEQKLKILETYGVPYQTLLLKPGHVGIYLGVHQGQPLMFHAPWGVKTRLGNQTGRNVIGQAVITTLNYGTDVPHYDKEAGTFLDGMNKMVIMDPASGAMN